ncbi:deoxyguanosinetriphosphate triphosphohydrolase [Tropheryma whipplei]|uniref:deoxyguanosinetriphosphate triphosphohydrolase n=1 Tax=Tropheryma whipplei TaxID=2039 RepID=UPI00030B253E|nr:deoxyguanosinetriphosphate triphosphohydrolase [Tropheryma whipplei]
MKQFTYNDFDRERLYPEKTENIRDSFTRDRARVVHAAYMRRLADKTQVYSPLLHLTTVRNRLTHSVEVAQIGMDIAHLIGVNQNIVDTACLAHDIGHPPFGHNGERVLNKWACGIGGFEGNAQTFRVITRLEPKVYAPDTRRSFGLNLTRASLNAVCKYPWSLKDARRFCIATKETTGLQNLLCDCDAVHKFGFYEEDRETFSWVRKLSRAHILSIEAQIMDFADDVAYSVHDFEDSLLLERNLHSVLRSQNLPHQIQRFMTETFSCEIADKADEAFSNLSEMWRDLSRNIAFGSLHNKYLTGISMRGFLARLKNLTSNLIGRFAYAAIERTRESLVERDRSDAQLVVPNTTLAEIALLKSMVFVCVMQKRKQFYVLQAKALLRLVEKIWELACKDAYALDDLFREDWELAKCEAEKRRVVLDQIASLTDLDALLLMQRYCSESDAVREFLMKSESARSQL